MDTLEQLDEALDSMIGLGKEIGKLNLERTNLKLFLVFVNLTEEYATWLEGRDG